MTDPIKEQIRNRIRLAVYAYAYEFENDTLVSDAEFDALALTINPDLVTGNKRLDKFFQTKFDAHTGQWIHNHPELDKIRYLYHAHYKNKDQTNEDCS